MFSLTLAFFLYFLLTLDHPIWKWNLKFFGYLTKNFGDYYIIYYVFKKTSKRMDEKDTHKKRMFYLNFIFFIGLFIDSVLILGLEYRILSHPEVRSSEGIFGPKEVAEIDLFVCRNPLWVIDSIMLLVYVVILASYINVYKN